MLFKALRSFRSKLPLKGYTLWKQDRIKIIRDKGSEIEVQYRSLTGFSHQWTFKISNGEIHTQLSSSRKANAAQLIKIKKQIEDLIQGRIS
jgi:hypothetical protein